MSGMRIGVVYPTWPDMHGELIPNAIFNTKLYTVDNFSNYDQNELLPALVHFVHRTFAYLVFILGTLISWRLIRSGNQLLKTLGYLLIVMLITQVLLGIITVLNSIGEIPILWGVLHQGGALFLLTIVYFCYFYNKRFST